MRKWGVHMSGAAARTGKEIEKAINIYRKGNILCTS